MSSQLFPRWANTASRAGPVAVLLLATAVTAGGMIVVRSPYATRQNEPREQPIAFSHQHHVADIGIDCRYCHTCVEESHFANVPPTRICMNCHSQLWTDSPMLAPVRESWRQGKPIRWRRVHDVPDYVYFNHSIHVARGVGCIACHGRIDEMPLTWQAGSLQMRWCLDCHRDPEPSLRPREVVTKIASLEELGDDPEYLAAVSRLFPDRTAASIPPDEVRHQVAQEYGVRKLVDCYTCHR